MDKSLHADEPSSIDVALGKTLQRTYGQLTRRSFLSGATRKLISLAGIGVAAQIFPYLANEAKAQGLVPMCGLHGWICSSGTPCSGGSVGAAWVQCCQIPVYVPPCPTVFTCCSYTDFCGTRPANWGQNCGGVPPSGPSWCGGAPGAYICTVFNCSATTWQSLAACQNGCFYLPSCAY